MEELNRERRRLVAQRLALRIQNYRRQHLENQSNDEAFLLPVCSRTDFVLNHMTTCQAGKACTVPHCSSSRQIISHWKHCMRSDCPVCLPLKESCKKHPSESLDETCWQRVLLQFFISTDVHVARLQSSLEAFINGDTSSSIVDPVDIQPPVGLQLGQVGAIPVQRTEEWHQSVSYDYRNLMVCKILQAIFPNLPTSAITGQPFQNFIGFAQKVELDVYQMAKSKSEYEDFHDEKIKMMEKMLENLKKQQEQQLNHPQRDLQYCCHTPGKPGNVGAIFSRFPSHPYYP